MKSVMILVGVIVMAVAANVSPFVWGPNIAYLLEKKRPFARSIAYTIARGLTLTITSIAIVWAVLRGRSVDALFKDVSSVASTTSAAGYLVVGLALLVAGLWFWRNPPESLELGASPDDAELPRVWIAFLVGIGVAVPNALGVVWQVGALGIVIVFAHGDWVLIGLAALLWTIVGTLDLWGVALAFLLAPQWTREKMERLRARVPSPQPRTIALGVAAFGAVVLLYGAWSLFAR